MAIEKNKKREEEERVAFGAQSVAGRSDNLGNDLYKLAVRSVERSTPSVPNVTPKQMEAASTPPESSSRWLNGHPSMGSVSDKATAQNITETASPAVTPVAIAQLDASFAYLNSLGKIGVDKVAAEIYSRYANEYAQNAGMAARSAEARARAGAGGYGTTYASAAGAAAYGGVMSGMADVRESLYDLALKRVSTAEALNGAGSGESVAGTAEPGSDKVGSAVMSLINSENFDPAQRNTASAILKEQGYTDDEIEQVWSDIDGIIGAGYGDIAANPGSGSLSMLSGGKTEVTSPAALAIINYAKTHLDTAYGNIGYDANEWSQMDDDARAEAVLDAAAAALDSGILGVDDYADIYSASAVEAVTSFSTRGKDDKVVKTLVELSEKLETAENEGDISKETASKVKEVLLKQLSEAGVNISMGLYSGSPITIDITGRRNYADNRKTPSGVKNRSALLYLLGRI